MVMKDALSGLKLLLLVFFLNACETDLINPVKNIPENKPKLVVNAYISPQDSIIAVNLTVSRPVLGKDTSFYSVMNSIPEAKVWITDLTAGSTDTLFYLGWYNGFYHFDCDTSIIKLKAGRKYRLNVITGSNLKTQAECIIPYPNTTLVIDQVDTFTQLDPYHTLFHYLRIKYHFNINRKDEIYLQPVVGVESIWGGTMYSPGKFYFEKNSDNKTFVDVQEVEIYDANMLHLILMTTDKAYYLYNNALDKLQNSIDNPFAEPVYLYSNISGGLGVFAAYNSYEITLKL
jgi:hypothetical protein